MAAIAGTNAVLTPAMEVAGPWRTPPTTASAAEPPSMFPGRCGPPVSEDIKANVNQWSLSPHSHAL